MTKIHPKKLFLRLQNMEISIANEAYPA